MSSLFTEANGSVPYPPIPADNFPFGPGSLHSPHGGVGPSHDSAFPSPMNLDKRTPDSSPASYFPSDARDGVHASSPPSKRPRIEQPSVRRVPGACSRCKRIKMKCTFADDGNTCARCIMGSHECIVLGRKIRSVGMREILRKQIRAKDAMIDNLLAQLNPTAPSATPMTLNVAKLALSSEQRHTSHDVLTYFEKFQTVRMGDKKIEVSTFDEDSEYESDSDSGEADGNAMESPASFCKPLVPPKCTLTGLLAKTALETKTRSRFRLSSPTASTQGRTECDSSDELASLEAGIGNLSYFEPGPSSNLDLRRLIIERQAAPDILLSGLVTNEDVGKLFDIFWKRIDPVMPILDENIHTPAAVLSRCPFLFTVICALSSRFYDEKPEMYALAIYLAKAAAASSFLDGWKTVEMCQAYTLMSSYIPPARRWDEDRSRFYSGIAVCLAIDLDLHQVPDAMPTDERGEREVLNRLRTYIVCYIADRESCLNLGKPFMIPEVELIRNVGTMFNSTKYRVKSDAYLVSLVELYRIMSRFMRLINPSIEPRSTDMTEAGLIVTHKVFSIELTNWETAAAIRCESDRTSPESDHRLRSGLMQLTYQYCRLVTFSAGLQQIVRLGKLREDVVFFPGCLHSASAVIRCIIDHVLPTGFVRYSPDHIFALPAFGTAVLMKCLRPEFSSKLLHPQELRIIDLIRVLVHSLDKEQALSEDETAPSRCYSKFLSQLLTTRVMCNESTLSPASAAVAPQTRDDISPPTFTPSAVGGSNLVDVNAWADLSFLDSWDPQQDPSVADPLLVFSETEYMQAFMIFPDQPWFMS